MLAEVRRATQMPRSLPSMIPFHTFHTWNSEESPSLFVPQNLLSNYMMLAATPDLREKLAKSGHEGDVRTDCEFEPGSAKQFNGISTTTFQPRETKCTTTLGTLSLDASHLNGSAVYLLVQAKLWAPTRVHMHDDRPRDINIC